MIEKTMKQTQMTDLELSRYLFMMDPVWTHKHVNSHTTDYLDRKGVRIARTVVNEKRVLGIFLPD